MSNSSLVVYTSMSPNHSGARTMSIDRITPHCTAGPCDIRQLGNLFLKSSTAASANYGVDRNGQIGLFVPEDFRSWCSSSAANDQRAVTIECSSTEFDPYEMTAETYKALTELCVDICRRHGKTRLIWKPDRAAAEAYTPGPEEILLTVHRWYAAKACPGEWLYSRLPQLADTVTVRLQSQTIYRVQLGAFRDRKNAEKFLSEVQKNGYPDAFISTR